MYGIFSGSSTCVSLRGLQLHAAGFLHYPGFGRCFAIKLEQAGTLQQIVRCVCL